MAKRSDTQTLAAIATVIGAAMPRAGSDGGGRVGTVPIFSLCGALAFAINWLAFIPSALAQTERYYDVFGGISYVTVTAVAVLLSD